MTETRITNPTTGGQKGQKPEQMSLLPIDALSAVARVYAFGAEKYDRNNWRRGYDWHLSYDAIPRHLMAFWNGEDTDPESGEPHMAHVIFHALTLITFMDEYPEGDPERDGFDLHTCIGETYYMDEILVEETRYSAVIGDSAEAIVDALHKSEGGVRYLPPMSITLLEEAILKDPVLAAAYVAESRV